MYTLRNVAMKRPNDIKNKILEQIGGYMVPQMLEFDLSYYLGKEKNGSTIKMMFVILWML